MRALNLIPKSQSGHYGNDAFTVGLQHYGFEVVDRLNKPTEHDVLVAWNRRPQEEHIFRAFEHAGARCIVAENGFLGKKHNGHQWYALALGHHNGAGHWPNLGPDRWASFGIPLAPWRAGGGRLVLGQRSIGELGVRSPTRWGEAVAQSYRMRLRQHPGATERIPLEQDLADVEAVVIWASGGGIKALTMGVAVFHDYPKWIGALAARPLNDYYKGPLKDDERRLAMFERLAWAMWRREEIANGVAIKTLLEGTSV